MRKKQSVSLTEKQIWVCLRERMRQKVRERERQEEKDKREWRDDE